MTEAEQITLVERYFAAVDGEDLDAVLATLQADCFFTVETHGGALNGHEEISGMLRRLWANHRAVKHHSFVHVANQASGRIASRFMVENTEKDGRITHKSNCNFFEITAGKFARVAVYMAGQNTLERNT
jgi:limonene-1,2-epoxide hydrolase